MNIKIMIIAEKKYENTNRAIFFSMAMSLAAKLLNFGQSMVVSYAFGTSASTDILFYSLSMVILLTTFQGAINHQVIIPVSIDLRKNKSDSESKSFVSYIYFIYAFIGLMSIAVLLLSPAHTISFLSRFSKEDITGNLGIVRLIIPSMLLIILNTYMLDIFTSYKYFTFPMILDMFKNLIIIVMVFCFKGLLVEESLALGILVGNLAQFCVLNVLLVTKIKLKLHFKSYKISKTIRKNIMFVVTGRVFTLLNDFVMIFILSGFSAGVFSAMDYAFKIDNVINMVIVGQITTIVGIRIVELHSACDFDELKHTFLKYLNKSLFFIIPICFIISLNAKPIISILFERGQFDGDDAEITSMFLRYFVLTVPLELVNGFIVILIIAKQIQRKAFRWQIFQNILNMAIVWFSVENFSYRGYPVAILVSFAIYIILLVSFLLKSEFDYIKPLAVLKPFITNVAVGVLAFCPIYFAFGYLKFDEDLWGNVLHVVSASSAFIMVFLAVSYLSPLHRGILQELYFVLKQMLVRKRLYISDKDFH